MYTDVQLIVSSQTKSVQNSSFESFEAWRLALQRENHIGKRNHAPFQNMFAYCIQDWPQIYSTAASAFQALAL